MGPSSRHQLFDNALLTLDNPSHNHVVQVSSRVHVTFPNYYSQRNIGLLGPATSNGPAIFLSWQGNTTAGTTDTKERVETDPKPDEEDIRWIWKRSGATFRPIFKSVVLSAWSGWRSLVLDLNAQKEGTGGLVRNHLITVSQRELVTIAVGHGRRRGLGRRRLSIGLLSCLG